MLFCVREVLGLSLGQENRLFLHVTDGFPQPPRHAGREL
jgi:hypothetical protein